MRTKLIMLSAALLCGCASSHNLKSDGTSLLGGGFLDYKVTEGMFEIIAKTNASPWVNTSAAKTTWRERATTLCGSDKFREFDIKDGQEDLPSTFVSPFVAIPSVSTTRQGFAVCESANLSDDDVRALLRKRARGLVLE